MQRTQRRAVDPGLLGGFGPGAGIIVAAEDEGVEVGVARFDARDSRINDFHWR